MAPSCAGTVCLAEMRAVPDKMGVCGCVWIPGLEARV